MTIVQFYYLLAVAEHKNFTIAAEKCFVTQPTLSMQIQKLEEKLDVLIFDRTKKPLKITEIGKKIIEQARNIVNESERINDIVAQHKGYIGGEFRLGIIPTVSSTILPMFLKDFMKKYPKVSLKIEEMNTQEIVQAILNGRLDAAITATPLKEDLIEEKTLFYEPFVAYVPENHRFSEVKKTINPSDLDINELLMLEDGHCFRDSVLNICNHLKETDEKDTLEIKSGNFETLIKLADEGMGMTLLPYLHTLDLNEKNKKNLRTFSDPTPAREISLIHHTNRLKINIIEAMYNLILGIVRGAIAFDDVKIISPKRKK